MDNKIRIEYEALEHNFLSELAVKASQSEGRERFEEQDDIRTVFQRDRDRIIHCKAFRRLKDKTQVFISPEGDHYRTRLTHTFEVSQIARTISRALRLNEDLTEAIALGHDLGHTPFGHAGETALRQVCSEYFKHNIQSVRMAQVLERDRKGLNLSKEVINGIENHTWTGDPKNLEGQVVRYADVIAYINHDIDDALRAEIITISDIPQKLLNILGSTHSGRLTVLIKSVVSNSMGKHNIALDEDVEEALLQLKKFMFEKVYFNNFAKEEEHKAVDMLKTLFKYYMKDPYKLPEEFHEYIEIDGAERATVDYLAGMTDKYAVRVFENLFIPKQKL